MTGSEGLHLFDEIKNTLKFFFKYLFLSFTLIVYFEPVRAESELGTFSLKLSIYQNSKNNRFLKKFYLDRNYSPIFVTKVNEGRASALLMALESTHYHGIPSALYKLNEIRYDIRKLRSKTELGALEVKLAKNFILYVKHMKSGVLDPEVINEKLIANAVLMDDVKVPKQLDLKLKKIDFASVFLTLRAVILPIAGPGIASATIIAFIFLHETLGLLGWVAIVLIAPGIVLVAINKKSV